ncbi:MAG: hypothetical protein KF705_12170 [Phycisphaeraceae bacterium]|nr:hypothetical protein [Phycisphaeraceae bacterium]
MGNKSDEPQVITLGSAQRRSIIDEILEETRSHVKETQRQMDAAFTGLDRARTVVLVLLAVACVVCAASLFLSWNAHKHSRASTTGAEKVTLRVDELNLRMNELDAQVVKYNFLIDALSVRIQGNQEAANQLDGRMNNLQASVEASERRLPAPQARSTMWISGWWRSSQRRRCGTAQPACHGHRG